MMLFFAVLVPVHTRLHVVMSSFEVGLACMRAQARLAAWQWGFIHVHHSCFGLRVAAVNACT